MRKVVICTEGQTEQIFVRELIKFMAFGDSVEIQSNKQTGGRRHDIIEMNVSHFRSDGAAEPKLYFLIYDCASDGRVATAVNDNYDRWMTQKFEAIVAIRDVAPKFKHEEIGKLRASMERSMRSDVVRPTLVLGTMEVEAWFIADFSHFLQLHGSLDQTRLSTFDNRIQTDIERIPLPAKLLLRIYESVGHSYTKSRADVEALTNRLDFHDIISKITYRTPSIIPLLQSIEAYLPQTKRRRIVRILRTKKSIRWRAKKLLSLLRVNM